MNVAQELQNVGFRHQIVAFVWNWILGLEHVWKIIERIFKLVKVILVGLDWLFLFSWDSLTKLVWLGV